MEPGEGRRDQVGLLLALFIFMYDAADERKKLGVRILGLRKSRGWSQEELANITGFGRSFTSSIEQGKKDVRLSTLLKLANIFGVEIGQLLK